MANPNYLQPDAQRRWTGTSMTNVHEEMVEHMFWAKRSQLDWCTSVDTTIFEVSAAADSMEWDFDLKRYWLTKSRWSQMVNQYLDVDAVEEWLGKIDRFLQGANSRGIAMLRTKLVDSRVAGGTRVKVTRKWGSCMASVTYRNIPRPTITLHSRTSYLGYLSAMDWTVAWMLGKYVAHVLGRDMADFRFVWTCEAAQWHSFKCLAHVLCHPDQQKAAEYKHLVASEDDELDPTEAKLVKIRPSIKISRQWMRRVLREDADGWSYADTVYSTYRRIRRRYHTEVVGPEYGKQFEALDVEPKIKAYKPLPSVKQDDLDLSAIGLLLG